MNDSRLAKSGGNFVITTSKLACLAAGASLMALSAATGASAQPLVNPLIPASTRNVAPEATPNFLRPRVGVQAAYTDNVTESGTNKQSDVLGRLNVGLAGRYASPRATLDVNGDLVYDVYSKNQKFDTLSFNGVAAATSPRVLAASISMARCPISRVSNCDTKARWSLLST